MLAADFQVEEPIPSVGPQAPSSVTVSERVAQLCLVMVPEIQVAVLWEVMTECTMRREGASLQILVREPIVSPHQYQYQAHFSLPLGFGKHPATVLVADVYDRTMRPLQCQESDCLNHTTAVRRIQSVVHRAFLDGQRN